MASLVRKYILWFFSSTSCSLKPWPQNESWIFEMVGIKLSFFVCFTPWKGPGKRKKKNIKKIGAQQRPPQNSIFLFAGRGVFFVSVVCRSRNENGAQGTRWNFSSQWQRRAKKWKWKRRRKSGWNSVARTRVPLPSIHWSRAPGRRAILWTDVR